MLILFYCESKRWSIVFHFSFVHFLDYYAYLQTPDSAAVSRFDGRLDCAGFLGEYHPLMGPEF